MSLLNIALPLVSGYFKGKLAKKKEESQLEKELEAYERKYKVQEMHEEKRKKRQEELEREKNTEEIVTFFGPDEGKKLIEKFGLETASSQYDRVQNQIVTGYVPIEMAKTPGYIESDFYKNEGGNINSLYSNLITQKFFLQQENPNDPKINKLNIQIKSIEEMTGKNKDNEFDAAQFLGIPNQKNLKAFVRSGLTDNSLVSDLIQEIDPEGLKEGIIRIKFKEDAIIDEKAFNDLSNEIVLEINDTVRGLQKQGVSDFDFASVYKNVSDRLVEKFFNQNEIDNTFNEEANKNYNKFLNIVTEIQKFNDTREQNAYINSNKDIINELGNMLNIENPLDEFLLLSPNALRENKNQYLTTFQNYFINRK